MHKTIIAITLSLLSINASAVEYKKLEVIPANISALAVQEHAEIGRESFPGFFYSAILGHGKGLSIDNFAVFNDFSITSDYADLKNIILDVKRHKSIRSMNQDDLSRLEKYAADRMLKYQQTTKYILKKTISNYNELDNRVLQISSGFFIQTGLCGGRIARVESKTDVFSTNQSETTEMCLYIKNLNEVNEAKVKLTEDELARVDEARRNGGLISYIVANRDKDFKLGSGYIGATKAYLNGESVYLGDDQGNLIAGFKFIPDKPLPTSAEYKAQALKDLETKMHAAKQINVRAGNQPAQVDKIKIN